MMKIPMKLIGVVLVVVIIVLAYFALVGVNTKAKDIGEDTDPVNPKNPRVQIAYAVINVNCQIGNPLIVGGWWGKIDSIAVSTHAWVPGEAQVYSKEKWNLLGLFSSDTECWVTIKITGPNNYVSKTFTSDHIKVTVPRTDLKDVDFGPYTAKFWDAGTYSVAVDFYRMTKDDSSQLLASGTQSFSITGDMGEI